ncbi:Flavin-dependent oxidoreductase, luciferase family (includes alkanesulfonate monooxygenase SsuD and methylene tetrahydromethanopterin reductase) [Enhydrobacter aerosaccus]|uniref:Flavin-dependent oxidoreductase, luciferase family (Includes alkanesulfonate monooxygenase SsuD and methylene tetrahydromethanopterin reductase) n=1 Tax=Enhydrobacter aerosaccus TaxID=225324 RepID=A0A1T4R6E4_9HYPH|nr:LLM class flavin-dependent oxidoreductase [Enhydrobacter aerosaccus]SKA11457.1 Flavin-dependent oxidoreductase, luciferase family (includes alkanesulfonate monooxygenase SsuD and methylene tetrahydromethanopterin reductase) [Enhydrobacter aerosaccus]
MADALPALCLIAMPGRRRRTIELCKEAETRGFAGIYVPSPFGNMSMCEALSWNTENVPFATSIVPIYQRTIVDFAQSAAMMHEVSNGRFRLGIGIAHGPSYVRMGVTPGKPLADTRAFIEKFRAETAFGPLPPIIVAALRRKMVALAGELAEGVVFANVCRSHVGDSLAALPAAKRTGDAFFIGNMIPTCISDDVEAAKAVNRRTLTNYAFLPNYRNYWKEAGYAEEMAAIEKAIAEGRRDDVPKYLTDKWLADTTLFGPAAKVRDGVAAWRAAGVHTPILVPSSAAGNQMKAIEEVFGAFG